MPATKKAPPKQPQKMLRRTDPQRGVLYWSRLGWSPIYAMALDQSEAESQQAAQLIRFPDIEVIAYQKITTELPPSNKPYTR